MVCGNQFLEIKRRNLGAAWELSNPIAFALVLPAVFPMCSRHLNKGEGGIHDSEEHDTEKKPPTWRQEVY